MASLTTPANDRRRVQVQVGVIRAAPAARVEPNLLIIGLAGPSAAPIADRQPALLMRSTLDQGGAVGVEVVRLSSPGHAALLPSLGSPVPSMLRVAAEGCFASGARELRVALVHGADLLPWSFSRSDVVEALDPVLTDHPGAFLLFPDLAGPPDVGLQGAEDPAVRWARTRVSARLYAQRWMDNFQIACLDAPAAPTTPDEVEALLGIDLALCAFRGRPSRMRQVGWRSAAATFAGLMAATDDPVRGHIGRRVALPPSRHIRPLVWGLESDRRHDLAESSQSAWDRCAVLDVDDDDNFATVRSDPTFRRPIGQWSAPALRTVKALHRTVLRAAEAVLFRPVDTAHSLALLTALNQVLRPFIEVGVLVGAQGQGAPSVETEIVRDPAAPGLAGTISGQLRPWCARVRVRVELREGQQAQVEVQT